MDREPATGSLIEQRLRELGLTLPPTPRRTGNFVSGVSVGDLLFLSGQGSHDHLGKIGVDFDVETGYVAARECALRLLSMAREELGTLDRIQRVVKLLGFVNCIEGFDRSPQILNGASDLLVEVFGDAGRHARSAIGAIALPHNFAVEIEMIVRVSHESAES